MFRKLSFLAAAFLFFISPLCHDALAEDFTYMEIFSNVYATVQNSYVTETDNWLLLTGVLDELHRKFGKVI